jgi:hypothetical protein
MVNEGTPLEAAITQAMMANKLDVVCSLANCGRRRDEALSPQPH